MEQASYQPKGMRQDESFLNFDKNYALENKNIRISTTGLNSKYSLTNERGNKKCTLNYVDIDPSKNKQNITLEGTVIGEAKVGKYWVIFTTGTLDRIYRLEQTDEDTFEVRLLIEDDLNFDVKHPLETVSYVETENIQKVYWVDGKIQLRLLNVVDPDVINGSYNSKLIEAVTSQQFKEIVSINKLAGSGVWNSGTVQYVCTYVSNFGQETNPFYVSPLHYLTSGDKAVSQEDSASCFFNITIKNIDSTYKYVRIYSIVRPVQGNPIVKLVAEVEGQQVEGYIYDTTNPQSSISINNIDAWNSNVTNYEDIIGFLKEAKINTTIGANSGIGAYNLITSNPGNQNIYIFKDDNPNECYFYGYYNEESRKKTWFKRTYTWSSIQLFNQNVTKVTIENKAIDSELNTVEYDTLNRHSQEISDQIIELDSNIKLIDFIRPLCIDEGIDYSIVYNYKEQGTEQRIRVGFFRRKPFYYYRAN